jgi:hypothetical protein
MLEPVGELLLPRIVGTLSLDALQATSGVFNLPTILPTIRNHIMGRGILLWMLGVPLPIILLLAMCSHG